ncbi:MAG TPA: hypothetical protein VMM79_05045 [Longimicrobiales bacterium]|nr:hypothetical protein [Longimicrobiales bacterium]
MTHFEHAGLAGTDRLGCEACHTHDSGDVDLTITTGGCFLCHADLPPAGSEAQATIAASACTACHVQPGHTAFATSGAPIDHAAVLDRGISCLLCHYDVATGSGASPAATCRTCHGVPGGAIPLRGGEAMDAATVHGMHMDTAIVMSCTRCHTPVEHQVIRLASSLRLECQSCHDAGDPALNTPVDSTAHRAVQELYAGLDPHHPAVDPALKFIERVACTTCHVAASTAQPAGSAERFELIRQECDACHGARFGSLLDPWIGGIRRNTALVGSYVRTASSNAQVRGNATADSIARDAVSVWQHVSDGDGVHNLPAADGLLRAALASAARSYRHVGEVVPTVPALGPDPEVVTCVRCHYGVQTIENPVYDVTFSHKAHVLAGSLQCSRCHGQAELFEADGATFDPAHGRTLIMQADCASCHHIENAGDCTACHARSDVDALRVQADLTVHVQRDGLERRREVAFSHDAHATVECADCHQSGVAQNTITCNECHESHHTGPRSPATCNACHGSGLMALHERTDHLLCGACHAPATLSIMENADRRFCLQCHTTMADHRPAGECSTCHLLIPPDEAMRRIVGARTIPRGRQ